MKDYLKTLIAMTDDEIKELMTPDRVKECADRIAEFIGLAKKLSPVRGIARLLCVTYTTVQGHLAPSSHKYFTPAALKLVYVVDLLIQEVNKG